ncbi:MAG: PIG-L deacetylase family protein [Microthrixaceae bacterium]
MGGAAVFLHAHPDDEAIFTGGTMAALVDAGVEVAVVFATAGERGGEGDRLGPQRTEEADWAADVLGVSDVRWLGFADSGLANPPPTDGFAAVPPERAARSLAAILEELSASCVVGYDELGIYGHPDHLAVHRVAHAAAALVGCPTVYEATVDREHLHFVESHLVEEAHRSTGLGLAAVPLGTASVELDVTVDVSTYLGRKRAAMAAHSSQVPAGSSALSLARAGFADVYGLEWYRRHGPRSVIDRLEHARSGW